MGRVVMWGAVVVGLVGFGGLWAIAQDDEPMAEVEYAYGSVAEVGDHRLVVNEFDETTGTMTMQTYAIAPDVTLYDVDRVSEIAVGDEVDVDYVARGDERVAVAIAVGKFVEDVEEEVE